MRNLFCVLALLVLTQGAAAESRPQDSSHPMQPPRFYVGLQVQWSDGSQGHIVGAAVWEGANGSGQWHYPVQFGGPDSLCWSLPEQGLTFVED